MVSFDAKEFDAVYREYAGLIYRYLMSLGCPPQDGEDVVQETFVKALLSIDQFRGDCRLEVWLCRIAKNTWLTALKKHRREPPMVLEDGRPDSALWEWLDLVDRLDEPYRAVFRGRVLGGLEYAQLAQAHGKSESWARVTYHRARRKIIEMLNEGGTKGGTSL